MPPQQQRPDEDGADDGPPFVSSPPVRVAVVGGGVAGLAAAWHIDTVSSNEKTTKKFDVHLFESDDRLGGHAHTVSVPAKTKAGGTTREDVNVDVGFMVYNDENYPNMVKWFEALDSAAAGGNGGEPEATGGEVKGGERVKGEDSDMSLSVSLDANGGDTDGAKKAVEWSSDGLAGLLANGLSQLASPSFYSLLSDMTRFNATAADLLALDPSDPRRAVTTGQYLRENGYGEPFCVRYLLPMMAALWSASLEDVLEFPAAQLIGFLCHHRMLQVFDRPQWKTVAGRSRQYTEKVGSILNGGGDERVHLSTPVVSVTRVPATKQQPGGAAGTTTTQQQFAYELFTTSNVSLGIFDEIIFAAHPPSVADMLSAGTDASKLNTGGSVSSDLIDTLSAIKYADNVVYVHSDPALMPRSKQAWSSWNCLGRYDLLADKAASISGKKMGEHGAMEGGETGFGNVSSHGNGGDGEDGDGGAELEGPDGRMKAVYVTYWLNRLQNLNASSSSDDDDTTVVDDVFVSLNPHVRPDPSKTYRRQLMAHPQFTPSTLRARSELKGEGCWQGKDGLWFAGAWDGYGFHEDGCRSGLEAACGVTGAPVPWAAKADETTVVGRELTMVLPPPDLSASGAGSSSPSPSSSSSPSSSGVVLSLFTTLSSTLTTLHRTLTIDLPIKICRRIILSFLRSAIHRGRLELKLPDGSVESFGDGQTVRHCADESPVTIRVFDEWFFVKTALEYDLGMARSYMSGHFVVEPLTSRSDYDPVIHPPSCPDETSIVLGDPVGLTRLFLLFIANRDDPSGHSSHPAKSAKMHSYSHALSNASGLLLSKIGTIFNYWRYKLTMSNSERGGSLKNIHAHYDLSNDLFTAFLDGETYMYSSAIYDAIKPTSSEATNSGLVFRGTLEEAQWRKLDTLLDRAQIQPGQTMLDIGFGWGGLSLHAAKKYGCKVTGITLSVEQMALANQRVKAEGLEHLITFEVVDYRTFARRLENAGKFDRVLSCEMIEAVGHEHLGEFFWAVEQVLKEDGILVMEAITTPEARYETYRRSTDFINTIIFPGSCCPSLHALIDASYQNSRLTLEHIDNIGLHYARTLAEWRRRFNGNAELVKSLGFDDVFMRVWNYYLTYCEAGFQSQTENCLILVFGRPGCTALVPLCETREVTQEVALTEGEVRGWLTEK